MLMVPEACIPINTSLRSEIAFTAWPTFSWETASTNSALPEVRAAALISFFQDLECIHGRQRLLGFLRMGVHRSSSLGIRGIRAGSKICPGTMMASRHTKTRRIKN
jgi:hypothetical protein